MTNRIKKIIISSFDKIINLYFFFLIGCFITDYSFILKDGISNLSIHGLIFVLLLFVRWFIDRQSFTSSIFIRFIKYIAKFNDKILLALIFLIFIFILFPIGLMRHFAFSSSGIDLGAVDQSIWNTLHGSILFSSLAGNVSYFGAHFEPILLLITPFYLIWSDIIVLIFLQAVAISLAIFPLYLIANQRLNNRLLIFVFVFAYFLSRPLRGVGLLDFHSDVFLIPLVFASYYFLVTKRIFWATSAMVLMLCCKETAAVLVFAYGIFTITYLKRYRLGISLLALAIAWWVLVTNFVMPRFAHVESYPYLKWLPFGVTYSDNLSAVIRNPLLLVKLFFSGGKTGFYAKLFVPLGLLSFLSPQHYILFLLPLAVQVAMSVNHGSMVTITSHYPAHTLPFIFISAIYGAGKLIDLVNTRLSCKNRDFAKKITFFIGTVVILFSLSFFGKSDGHKLAKFIRSADELHSYEIRQALKSIPEEASVSAVHRIVPHLTHRKYIYIWENSPEARYLVEYVVLHRQLIESDGEQFGQILSQLNKEGFKEICADSPQGFYIFYNPWNYWTGCRIKLNSDR